MSNNTSEFLELCIRHDILSFGEYTLKSGRVSPYFFNSGKFDNGLLLGRLADHYAELIHRTLLFESERYMLYGPAYKGIPLVSACSIRLADRYGLHIPYAFNRKEAKDHAEGGTIVGAELSGKVIIVDDVITAGTSVKESIQIIRSAGAIPSALIIALDRQEISDDTGLSAVQLVEKSCAIPVHPIARLSDLIQHLTARNESSPLTESIKDYRNRYGVTPG